MFPFLSHVQVFSCEIFFFLLLEMSIYLLFFPIFSGYFCSVDACIFSIVSGGCNQFFSEIFYVVF